MAVRTTFGTVRSQLGDDARVIVANPGQKAALALTACYDPNGLAYDMTTFIGRLYVFQGAITDPPLFLATTSQTGPATGPLMFELALTTVGPHAVLFPIGNLFGNPLSSPDVPITIILTQAKTAVGGQLFRAILNVSGTMIQSSSYGL